MNTDNICINGAEIQEVMWKIGSNPWASNFIQPFTQGDMATAILKVTLDDCAGFEGKMLESFVQVPNDAKDIVKIFALIDANNQALFTLPTELLWWPGDYNVQFMFADGDKVNYSNVLNAAYTVNDNPALAGQNPPTILPGDKADYEDLISRLSTQTAKGDVQIPKLESENTRAEGNISTITSKNTEAEQKISDLTGKISEGNAAQVKWQDTINNGESKIGELDVKIQETNQKMIEVDNKISDIEVKIVEAEAEINKMEEAVAKGVKEIDDAVNALPDQIKKIEDKTTEGLTSLTDQEAVSVQNIKNQETTSTQNVNNQGLTSVQAIKDQEALSRQELTSEGVNQRGLISTAGNTEVLKVTNEGHAQKNSITTEGDNQKGLITAEGTKQTGLVKTQGDTSLAAVQHVQTEVERIIQGDPAGGNAIALGGKTRAEFDGEIQENKEKLQNCVQTLDDSIVAIISGKGISSNVVGNDAINVGGNVIEGTEVSFVKTKDGFEIGEGYENLRTTDCLGTYNTDGVIKDNEYTIIMNAARISCAVSKMNFEANKTYRISGRLKNHEVTNIYAGLSYNEIEKNIQGNEFELIFEALETAYKFVEIRFGESINIGDVVVIEDFIVSETGNKVPFVPHSFRGGELKTADSYNETDYTIISLDEAGVEQEYYIDGEGKVNFHLKQDGVTKINSITSFAGVYKKLTAEDKQKEIDKINSGKYTAPVEMQGTTFPIEDMVRRADKYGIVEQPIEVTNNSRDLWYSADEGIYEVIDDNLDVTRIKSKDINSTSSPIRDVSGRGRLNAAIALPAYLRKVK